MVSVDSDRILKLQPRFFPRCIRLPTKLEKSNKLSRQFLKTSILVLCFSICPKIAGKAVNQSRQTVADAACGRDQRKNGFSIGDDHRLQSSPQNRCRTCNPYPRQYGCTLGYTMRDNFSFTWNREGG